MKKFIFLAIFSFCFFSVATVQSQDNFLSIQYQVLGDKKRVDAVVSYMTRHGYSATPIVEPGVFGQLNGKKWPGVRVARLGAGVGEGIFVPVSDNALAKGLCSDQKELLTNLPKNNQPAPAVNPCGCGDRPWPAKGIWADFPAGAHGIEIQNKPAEYVKKIKFVVREGDIMNPICCFKKSVIPSFDEMEATWGGGSRLSLWKDFEGCDGGSHCTNQILIFQ